MGSYTPKATQSSKRLFNRKSAPSLEEFRRLCSQSASREDFPRAVEVKSNIPIYDLATFDLDNETAIDALQDEWHTTLHTGPGVFVVRNLTSPSLISSVNTVYDTIIQSEASSSKGDHFSSGSNSRIWNSFSKHCLADPKSFIAYYSNPWLQCISESWLGPAYRITAQVNVVRPGGKAQMPHRDYHLGFQSEADVAKFPRAMHVASQFLTLQGAVAHTDMPLESGPTRFLPFSQGFEGGFMAYRRPEFVDYFDNHWVALPLKTGDGVFFNPALFHAAGENVTSDFSRSANLLQISSAFGKPMETIDTLPLVEATYSHMAEMYKTQGMNKEVEALIGAVAEGYPFPTNLDRRQPSSSGMAPDSEQDVLRRALVEGWDKSRAMRELQQMRLESKA